MNFPSKLNYDTVLSYANKNCRPFNLQETMRQMRFPLPIVYFCWGAHAFTRFGEDQCLRFKVNGHKHSGHVYIFLAGNDTYTVAFSTTRGRVLHYVEGIFCEQLQFLIDQYVESLGAEYSVQRWGMKEPEK